MVSWFNLPFEKKYNGNARVLKLCHLSLAGDSSLSDYKCAFITWRYIICWSVKYTLGQWEIEGHRTVAGFLPASVLKLNKSSMHCWWHMYRYSLCFRAEQMQSMLLHTCFPLTLCSPVADMHHHLPLVERFLRVPSSKTFSNCIQFLWHLPVFLQVRICQDLQRVRTKLWARVCVLAPGVSPSWCLS